MKSNSRLRHLTISALLPGLRYIETASVHQNRTRKVAVWFDVEPQGSHSQLNCSCHCQVQYSVSKVTALRTSYTALATVSPLSCRRCWAILHFPAAPSAMGALPWAASNWWPRCIQARKNQYSNYFCFLNRCRNLAGLSLSWLHTKWMLQQEVNVKCLEKDRIVRSSVKADYVHRHFVVPPGKRKCHLSGSLWAKLAVWYLCQSLPLVQTKGWG